MISKTIYNDLSLPCVLLKYAGNLLYHTMGKAGLKREKPTFTVDLTCMGDLLLICTAEKRNPQTDAAAITLGLSEGFKALSWACFLNFKVEVEETDDNKIVKITMSL